MALDAGTTGVRALSFAPNGTPVDTAYRELAQHYPAPGRVEHDAAEIAALAGEVLSEVAAAMAARGDSALALGLTNQRETTVALDRASGRPTAPAIVWQDRRTADECARLVAAGAEPRVREVTGLVLDPYFSATKMRWLLDADALDGAREPALATVDAWLLYWLTGGVEGGSLLTEPSNASRTSLLDLATREWSPEMATLFGVDLSLLPEVVASDGLFGLVAASACPALAGTPITGVLGDQQAALFGQGCLSPGQAKVTYGTGSFVMMNVGAAMPPPAPGLLTTVAWDTDAPTYALEGSAFVAGAVVQWLRDELGLFAHSADLEPLAAHSSDGVAVVPAFTGLGSPFWRADARGAILGLSRASGLPQIARATIEALAFQVRAMTDAFAAAGHPAVELRADGGAAAMDTLLELQATTSRSPVLRSATLEATARGAALMAGLGVGLYRDEVEVAALFAADRRFDPGEGALLEPLYDAWLRAVERV
ncbi:MAG TPA: FGGY family carbohydrate kinase [Acidimicrobiales bacterium]|nr:FGGY family carbohydrate kinase [Acidimicrobiales bacterium]